MRGMIARREDGSGWKLRFHENVQACGGGSNVLRRAWRLLVRDVIPTLIILVVMCFVTLLFARYISEAKAIRGEVAVKGVPRPPGQQISGNEDPGLNLGEGSSL